MNTIIGRVEEQKILRSKLDSGEAELIAIYGRRRVGKTYLIRTYYSAAIVFEFTGIHDASLGQQLQNFSHALQKSTKLRMALAAPDSWVEAFSFLDNYLNDLAEDKKMVVFFDEFPWIHTQKSGFLQAFDHWWNSSASKKNNLKVIICGSAASWMIDKIIKNTGGLHNRVTQAIRLLPFILGETAAYLQSRGVRLDQYQMLQIYMATGGIPHYLKGVSTGESAAQAIDQLCFTKDGLLRTEFTLLYESLFTNAEHHEKIVRALAEKRKGLSRKEIIKECGFTSGGSTTRIIKELEESGFISAYIPFDKSINDSIYMLSDEYSLFYLKFIEGARATGAGTWLRKSNTASYTSWSGFAFESVAQKHALQIKKALGIAAVLTNISVWRYIAKNGGDGAQIDLLLDRQDNCINICEMKFSKAGYTIDRKYASGLDTKLTIFQEKTETRKTLFLTMITTYGTKKNEYYTGRVQAEVLMEDLFL